MKRKLKKPLEVSLHNSGSNVISINSLNTIIANAMEKSKLGEAVVDEYVILSPPSFEEKIFFDDTLPPIYDNYNHCDIFSPPTIEDMVYVDYDMPPIYDVYNDEYDVSVHLLLRIKLIMIILCLQFMMITMMDVIVLLPLLLIKLIMLMWRVMILLCLWIMIRML